MDGALLRKNVAFLGMWRTSQLNDDLAREIAMKSRTLSGQSAQLEVRTVGLRLYTRSGDQDGVIRMPSVQDIAINRYEPMVLLCMLKEGRKLAIVVCRCSNPRDSSDIMKSFRASRREGRSVEQERDSKRNWSLQQRHERSVIYPERGNRHKGSSRAPPVEMCHVGIQTGHTDSDSISLSPPSLPSNGLRQELAQLSEEVKAIKILIEKSTGVHDNEQSKSKAHQKFYTNAIENNENPYAETDTKCNPRVNATTDLAGDLTKKQQIHETHTFVRGEFVSAKSPGYGSDVINGTPPSDGALSCRPNSPDAVDSGVRSFSSLFYETDDTKNIDDSFNDREIGGPNEMSVESFTNKSPSSLSRNARLTTYITAPPGFQTQPERSHTSPRRRYYRHPKAIVLSSTVPKSIENVYRSTRLHRDTNRRSRQVLTPEVFFSHDKYRRQRSHSAHDSNRGHAFAAEEDSELRKSLHTLYNEA